MHISTIVLRMTLSLVLGALVGWEREAKEKPAGLRTLTLVSVGSTLFVILSVDLMSAAGASQFWDPLRIVNALIQGIGFIGAGTVLRRGDTVQGLTTAAALWSMTAVGAAIGLGMYSTAVVGTLTILTILHVFEYVENRWFADDDNHAEGQASDLSGTST